jgi:hypothetical protein
VTNIRWRIILRDDTGDRSVTISRVGNEHEPPKLLQLMSAIYVNEGRYREDVVNASWLYVRYPIAVRKTSKT